MNRDKRILFELRAANNALASYAGCSHSKNTDMQDMTILHGRIIKYLSENEEKDIFQKDIETLLSVRRSTVTTIIKCMEKNGLITRTSVMSDARLKKLRLTDRARSILEYVGAEIERTEKMARTGISDEELNCFFSVLDKIKSNLKTD